MEFKAKDRRLEGDTVLRQCQLTQVYLLDVIVEICERHGLRYYLDYGTLIGAMRHDGFIPWDDDIDVTMPTDDYEKFVNLPASEFPEMVFCEKPGADARAFHRVFRVRDKRSVYLEWCTTTDMPCGIFVDVFPLDCAPKVSQISLRRLQRLYYVARFNEQAHRQKPNKTAWMMPYHMGMSIAWTVVSAVLLCWFKLLCFVRPGFVNQRFGVIDFCLGGIEASAIFPLARHVFEGKEYNVPRDADRYLTRLYGDWRTPPPVEKQVGKHNTYMSPLAYC